MGEARRESGTHALASCRGVQALAVGRKHEDGERRTRFDAGAQPGRAQRILKALRARGRVVDGAVGLS
ncbi:MAG: hypothetical protein ABI910_19540 [Gemmatimonadota bacterium]